MRLFSASAHLTLILFATVGLLISSCQDVGEGDYADGEWALYRLADPTLTSDQLRNEPLSNLRLADVPFISARDILSYNWKTHSFECISKTDSLLDSLALHGGSTRGVPFVVTVNKAPIYVGSFWWGYSSMMPWSPYVELAFPRGHVSRSIQLPPLAGQPDPRSDMRIYWALRYAGVLTEE
jgi:hypothetical protein